MLLRNCYPATPFSLLSTDDCCKRTLISESALRRPGTIQIERFDPMNCEQADLKPVAKQLVQKQADH